MVVMKVLPLALVVGMAMGSSTTADVTFVVLPAEFVVVMMTAGRVVLEVTVLPFEFVVVMGRTALAVGVNVVVGVGIGAGGAEGAWEDLEVGSESPTAAVGIVVGVTDGRADAVLEAGGGAETDRETVGVESSELGGSDVGGWLDVDASVAAPAVPFDGVWRLLRSCTAATMSLLARRGFLSCTFSTPWRPLSKTPSLNCGIWPWRAAWSDSSGRALIRSWKSCRASPLGCSVGEGGTCARTALENEMARTARQLSERMAVGLLPYEVVCCGCSQARPIPRLLEQTMKMLRLEEK